jgi:Raf kinase inhibitor-like YbhB/YbcL family protein
MKLHSDSFEQRMPLPSRIAMGAADGFGGNRNPSLAWSDVPEGVRSFALLCIDPDAPSDASLAGKADVEIPIDHLRGDFVHWVMVDIPADLREIAEGNASDRITTRGKRNPNGPHGARQGLNGYTAWFASNDDMRGDYRGYDGPYPPPNDLRTHRYFFRLFALDVARLDLPERFGAPEVLRAIQGHVLIEALTYGTYALHVNARG